MAVDFSEAIAASDMKVSRSRHLIEYMKISLWNNSLISISILRDYWLVTMRDGHKHLLIYLD